MKYKVWVHIEEIDEDGDCHDLGEPVELGSFESEQEATNFAIRLEDVS